MTQPRERSVPCAVCYADTWNNSGLCSRHDALLGNTITSYEDRLREEAAASKKYLAFEEERHESALLDSEGYCDYWARADEFDRENS